MVELGEEKGLSELGLCEPVEVYEESWPHLTKNNFEPASPCDPWYNCIAYATSTTHVRWWPGVTGYFWPNSNPAWTVENFKDTFCSYPLRYEECDSDAHEPDYEKVALYTLDGVPTHMARQREDGKWVSKLGDLEDIVHEKLDVLNDGIYGKPEKYFKRPFIREHS